MGFRENAADDVKPVHEKCGNPPPSTEDISLGIRQGYRSAEFSFLETRDPTDTLPDDLRLALSNSERTLLEVKKKWLASPFPARLADIVEQIIEDRRDSPITNAICLGVGTGLWRIQFLVFSQVVAQLSVASPDILCDIIIQDPFMSPEMRTLFANHGCRVVEAPAAFNHLNSNTFLMSTFISADNLRQGFEDSKVEEIALFIGDGDETLSGAEGTYTGGLHEIEITGPLFDEDLCDHLDFPTDRVQKEFSGGGLFPGLSGLDIWWRPIRTEAEILSIQFESARSLGFPEDLKKFERAFDRGYSKLAKMIRERIVYSFVAARRDKNTESFEDYFVRYYTAIKGTGLVGRMQLYESGFRRWQSIVNDRKQEQRTWLQYIDGRRWLIDQPRVLTPGWDN